MRSPEEQREFEEEMKQTQQHMAAVAARHQAAKETNAPIETWNAKQTGNWHIESGASGQGYAIYQGNRMKGFSFEIAEIIAKAEELQAQPAPIAPTAEEQAHHEQAQRQTKWEVEGQYRQYIK